MLYIKLSPGSVQSSHTEAGLAALVTVVTSVRYLWMVSKSGTELEAVGSLMEKFSQNSRLRSSRHVGDDRKNINQQTINRSKDASETKRVNYQLNLELTEREFNF